MDNKPIILTEDISLVEHDLRNVYRHYKAHTAVSDDVKFKKKENIGTMSKAILKHRIQNLTGKSLPVIESEMGQSFDSVDEVRKLAKLLLLEAFGKLPFMAEAPQVAVGKKRPIDTEADEPFRKRSRKSTTATSSSNRDLVDSCRIDVSEKKSRRSFLDRRVEPLAEPIIEDENMAEVVEDDLIDIGPNPTPQMVAMKRKSLAAKKGTASPRKKAVGKIGGSSPAVIASKTAVALPSLAHFPGDKDSSLFLVKADLGDKKFGPLEFTKVQKLVGPNFQGANLIFLHTPVEWSPADVFTLVMNVKLLNRKAKLNSFLVLIGCGVSNVNLFRDALYSHSKHVQLVVFENEEMNKNAESNATMLRDTTALFLLAYFFSGCEDENTLPPSRMTRPGATTCFRTKSAEDLENTVIHTFSEEGDWVFDVCCKGRELSLAGKVTVFSTWHDHFCTSLHF